MISIKNSIPIMILLLLTSCDLFSSGSQDYGACKDEITDLLEFLEERDFVRIVIDLKMEDFVPESELDEDQREQQKTAIIELQDKFLNILEENGILFRSVRRPRFQTSPWLAMYVEEEEGLLFICRHDMVEWYMKIR